MKHAVVIGSGVSGLTAAYTLVKAGVEPTLLSPDERPGGLLFTQKIDGNVIECGPDSVIGQKSWALEFWRELGLGDEIIGSNDKLRRTYIWRNSQLIPMPDGMQLMVPTKVMPILASPLLSLGTKLRMATEIFGLGTKGSGGDRSVASFVREHYGDEAVDYLAEPLLAGVYGGDVDLLSARSTLTSLVDLEAKYGSLARGVLAQMAKRQRTGSVFYTLKKGMQSLGETLWHRIEHRTNWLRESALSVSRTDAGYSIRTATRNMAADAIIFAIPAMPAGDLLQGLRRPLGELLTGIPHSSCITVTFAYRASELKIPEGFGLLVPRRERQSLAACTFLGQKFPHRPAPNSGLIRCFLSGEVVMAQSDDEVAATARRELQEKLNITAIPKFTVLNRWPHSMPQYVIGHAERVAAIEAHIDQLPGVALASNYLYGIGIPDSIASGKKAAERIRPYLQTA